MEWSKKYGKSSWAKHLRNKTGGWTKRMANSKSRMAVKTMMDGAIAKNDLPENF